MPFVSSSNPRAMSFHIRFLLGCFRTTREITRAGDQQCPKPDAAIPRQVDAVVMKPHFPRLSIDESICKPSRCLRRLWPDSMSTIFTKIIRPMIAVRTVRQSKAPSQCQMLVRRSRKEQGSSATQSFVFRRPLFKRKSSKR